VIKIIIKPLFYQHNHLIKFILKFLITDQGLTPFPAAGIPVSYAQTGLKLQPRRKKINLTAKPALVIRMSIVCANGRFNMLGCS